MPILNKKRLVFVFIGIFILLVLAYFSLVRAWMLNWGATPSEAAMSLPGDDLVPSPSYQSTRALTIQAPADQAWAWLVQLGQNRGGYYSYSWLENLVFADIHNTDQIVSDWQQPKVGDFFSMTPRNWPLGLIKRSVPVIGVRVHRLEPKSLLVLKGWGSFVLQSITPGTTRFIVRGRSQPMSVPAEFMMSVFFDPLHFVMERQMMMGLKRRAEGLLSTSGFLQSLASAGFIVAALAGILFVLTLRRKRPWLAAPVLYALLIILSTADLQAALVGLTALSLIVAGCLFFRRWWWSHILFMFVYVHIVLFLPWDAYLVFGLIFLIIIPSVVILLLAKRGFEQSAKR
jgi:hypothetical protein